MKLSDFYFDLPESLIAKYPTPDRAASRLLSLNGTNGEIRHGVFSDILDNVQPNDLLVFNNTRVIPARLLGQKSTGGKVEVLIERILDDHRALAHVRSSKSPKPGAQLTLENVVNVTMLARHDALFELRFDHEETVLSLLESYGHMPLPPYIDRPDEDSDKERYQTVYNEKPGAVAAPTAGLHFTDEILKSIQDKGAQLAFVTLHVGAGTFQPVKVDNVLEHQMHSEFAEVSQDVIDAIHQTRERGGRVIAVGTTSVRSLESAAKAASDAGQPLGAYCDDTDIFIYPGYEFQLVDAMVTNFHLPESTLIMLISAFAGQDKIMKAYQAAIDESYRFFSYGDAMFITRNK